MFLENPNQLGHIPKKIISLVPSQTELLHDLDLEEETIGLTKFCYHPKEWYRSKERIGGTKTINIKKIISLQPDLIIANKEENIKEQVEELAKIFPVWLTDVNSLDDALKMITDIGTLTNRKAKAKEITSQIKKTLPDQSQSKKVKQKVIYLIWRNPYMGAGGDTFINDMISRAGFDNLLKNKKRYPTINLEEFATKKFALIFLSSEPYPFKEKHILEINKSLPNTKVILVDGEYFSWYGSRLLKSAAYFKKLREESN
jgi:ABC-type Fe3+-hydroxamate transport system substrate-binding protein